MNKLILAATISTAVLGTASCGGALRDSKAPVLLTVSSITSSNGNFLLSDVVKNATVFDDLVTATLSSTMKNTSLSPTSLNQITVNRYRVDYQRADGHNVQGTDVPYAFDAALTSTVVPNSSQSVSVEIVRHTAKLESPLAQLASSRAIISVLATVTFYGVDAVGTPVSASGQISINFGNFADQ